MLKELYPSNFKSLNFDNSAEWLPFFDSKKKTVAEMSTRIVKLNEKDAFFAYYDKNHLLFIVGANFSHEIMEVNSILAMNSSVRLKDYQKGLEEIGKEDF